MTQLNHSALWQCPQGVLHLCTLHACQHKIRRACAAKVYECPLTGSYWIPRPPIVSEAVNQRLVRDSQAEEEEMVQLSSSSPPPPPLEGMMKDHYRWSGSHVAEMGIKPFEEIAHTIFIHCGEPVQDASILAAACYEVGKLCFELRRKIDTLRNTTETLTNEYLVLIVLFNMRSRHGLWIPRRAGEEENRTLVVPHYPFAETYLPTEKIVKQRARRIQTHVSEESGRARETVSGGYGKEKKKKTVTKRKRNTFKENVPTMSVIDNEAFTASRTLFHRLITQFVQQEDE